MTQDEMWRQKCQLIKEYIEKHHRLPSRHRIEDHRMLNWIKFNRKQEASGKLSAERQHMFNELMDAAKLYKKINQYAYLKPATPAKELRLDFEDYT